MYSVFCHTFNAPIKNVISFDSRPYERMVGGHFHERVDESARRYENFNHSGEIMIAIACYENLNIVEALALNTWVFNKFEMVLKCFIWDDFC